MPSATATWLPLRFVSEVLDGSVTWVQETKSILLGFSSAVEIDDGPAWFRVDPLGNQVVDYEVGWHRFS